MGEFMKYAFKMGSGAMIYIPSFINNGSSIQNLLGEGTYRRRYTDSMETL
jgi:hypothetical protein